MSPQKPLISFFDDYCAEIQKLREELMVLYHKQIFQAPHGLAEKVFQAACDDERTYPAVRPLIQEILAAARPSAELSIWGSSTPRAKCPLCGGSTQPIDGADKGFAIPEGLRRHLENTYSYRCEVLNAAARFAELRQQSEKAREAHPVMAEAEKDITFLRERKQLRAEVKGAQLGKLRAELKEAQFQERKELADALRDARKRLSHLNEQIQKQTAELKEAQSEKRKELADALRNARKHLTYLHEGIQKKTAFVQLFVNSPIDRAPEYPSTPPPQVDATETGQGLPSISGIYFVWAGGIVVYVGQSVSIANRARSKGHHAINPGDQLSWLPFQRELLNWAEAFYIGIHRPFRNFGGYYPIARSVTAAETEI